MTHDKKMSRCHLPRVVYHQVYNLYLKTSEPGLLNPEPRSLDPKTLSESLNLFESPTASQNGELNLDRSGFRGCRFEGLAVYRGALLIRNAPPHKTLE